MFIVFKKEFFGDPLSLGSCHVPFHSSLTVHSYARQLNILSNRTTALGMYSVLIPKDLLGSSLISWLKI